jgi:hypothetical protein
VGRKRLPSVAAPMPVWRLRCGLGLKFSFGSVSPGPTPAASHGFQSRRSPKPCRRSRRASSLIRASCQVFGRCYQAGVPDNAPPPLAEA